jgi:hypothetical protein
LEILNLEGNNITGRIPYSFSTLSRLKIIKLGENQISGALPDLSRMKFLKMIDLHTNGLSGSIPTSLLSISSIERIDLADNALVGCLPTSIEFTDPSLIDLEYNYFQCFLPGWDSISSIESCACTDGCVV